MYVFLAIQNEYMFIRQRERDLTGFSANAAILNPFKIIFFILNLFLSVTRILNWFVQNPFEKGIIYSKQGHTLNGKKETLQIYQKTKNPLSQRDACLENGFSSSIYDQPLFSISQGENKWILNLSPQNKGLSRDNQDANHLFKR